jgi:hypothetical protein
MHKFYALVGGITVIIAVTTVVLWIINNFTKFKPINVIKSMSAAFKAGYKAGVEKPSTVATES